MPPKRARRPAAAPRVLARPAARVRGVQDPGAVKDKFFKGKEVVGSALELGVLTSGLWIAGKGSTYYQSPVNWAGKVVREQLEGGEREVVVTLTGTSSEALLKYATSLSPALARIHLCSPTCPKTRENPDVLHATKIYLLKEDAETTWETSLMVEEAVDLLREDHEAWKKKKEEEDAKKKSKSDDSSDEKKKKKKKKDKDKDKKKDKKEKKAKKEKKKEKKEESSSTVEELPRLGGRAAAKKSLEAVYGRTGLDPSQSLRKKIARRMAKKLKKGKSSSSGGSSRDSTETESEGDHDLLNDRSKIMRVARGAPGTLAAMAVTQMKEHVGRMGGTGWAPEDGTLPPVLGAYTRIFVLPRTTGGISREVMTLAYISDLLLQGRVCEATDTAIQRLKSLELVANGSPWSTAVKLEIGPQADPMMSSRAEVQVAKKEARLDADTKPTGAPFEKGGGKGKNKDGGKNKGKDKGGKGKGKDNRKQDEKKE